MDERRLDHQEENYIDLSRLFQEFFSALRRLYWLPLVLMLIGGALYLFKSHLSYKPMYASDVTFTIQVNAMGSSDISVSSSYYDQSTAEQLGKTFPYLVQSDYFRARLMQALGTDSINGSITAGTIPDTNLFMLKVTSPSSKDALAILQAVISIYPQAADYIVGNTSMELLTQPVEATASYNAFDPTRSIIKGAVLGLAAGLALLLLFAATRRTVRTAEDVRTKLGLECLATLPAVIIKRRNSSNGRASLSIKDPNIPASFLEGIRSLRVKLLRSLSAPNYKTILITSTMPGEGKTTVAVNLAQALSSSGARVILVDADLRKPSVKPALGIKQPSLGLNDALKADDPAEVINMLHEQEPGLLWLLAGDDPLPDTPRINAAALRRLLNELSQRADYIIIDTPPCGLLADSVNIARTVDCVLYVLGAGAIQTPKVLDSLQFLDVAGTPLLGCVLNGASGSRRSGYGYGYGYDYGSGKHSAAKAKQ